MMNLIKLIFIISTLLMLFSCGSTIDNSNNLKVDDIYQKNNYSSINGNFNKPLGTNSGFVRNQSNELHTKFPLLPNPVLTMFVFPHLTQDGNPVPGYSTQFRMYKQDHYALPQEIY